MSSILLLIFIIALITIVIGLFLSRSPVRRSQNEYLVTAKGRRIVDAPAGRLAEREWAGLLRRKTSGEKTSSLQVKQRSNIQRTNALVVNPGRLKRRIEGSRLRNYLILGLTTVFIAALYLFNSAFPHSVNWTLASFGQPASTASPSTTNQTNYTASQHLIRLNQLDPAQYRTMQEYTVWSDSTCSTATITEVLNAYGHRYRITDILQVESGLGEITPALGLLEDVGIQRTAAKFGFKTAWGHSLSLDQVIAAANSGTPVIVSFPPSRLPPGHLVVVRGGDSNYVYLADSSARNWTQLTHARFIQLWAGFSAILTPA